MWPLTSTYNSQVLRITEGLPLNLVLTRNPSSIYVNSIPCVDLYECGCGCMMAAQFKKMCLRELAEDLKAATTKSYDPQSRYKADFDKAIRVPIMVVVGKEALLDRPRFKQRYRSDSEDRIEEEENLSKKLMLKTNVPCTFIGEQNHTVSINEDDILYKVSKDRISEKKGTDSLSHEGCNST